jgi:hypothetical protein
MCTGAEIIPLIASAVGTGASVYTQQQALRARDQEAARGIMEQANLQRQGAQRVSQNIQELQKSTPDTERQAAQNDFMAALQKAKLTQGGPGLSDVGGASERFAEDVSGARKAAGAESADTAGTLARIDAPVYQRQREATAAGATASDLALLARKSAGEDFLTQLRIATHNPNPWVEGIGQGLTAFGQTYAGRAKKPPVMTIGTPRPGPSTGP